MTEIQDLRMLKEVLELHAIVSITNVSGNITYVNDNFCRLSKYSREELIGQNHRLLNSGVHDAKFFKDMWQIISNGHMWQGEICNRNKEGGLYWVKTTIVPSLDENGRPCQYVSAQTDITSVKKARNALAKMNEDLERRVAERNVELKVAHSALKHAHDELQVSVVEMKLTHAKMMRSEVANNQQMNALAEANVRIALFYSVVEQMRQTNVILTENGDAFILSILRDAMDITGAKYGAMALFNKDGKLNRFLTEGISDAERQKIASNPEGKGLLQALYLEGRAMLVNSIADDSRSCGFPSGHPTMKSLLGVPLLVNGTIEGVIYLTEKHTGKPFSESDLLLMDMLAGEVIHVLKRSELIASLNKNNQALLLEKLEQQKLIAQLHDAQSHLLQADKMASIGQLAAGVAHEINNPIGYVYSNLGTLEKYVQDTFAMLDQYEQAEASISDEAVRMTLKEARNRLDIAFLKRDLSDLMNESKDGISRVKTIVQNLKDFSHVDNTEEWHFSDLHKGLESTLNIVSNEIKYKADVVKEYGDLPEVECLSSQLNQVFMNLLVNAAHAIEERGMITVRTGLSGNEVWVEIADTGHGINLEHLKKIFDPFFTTKSIGEGTGLGLSLSYGIVKKHNGRIEVQSEIGNGTTFRVCLPIRQENVNNMKACS